MLSSIGLEQYAKVLAENDVDFDAVRLLNEKDLQELGFSLGHRKKLLKAIAELDDTPSRASSSSPAAQRHASETGERRHATVVFSDLSGFTAMTEKLDPEEVEGLMRRLKDGAIAIVESHGGIVSQFVGDEVLALFGIPTAHEDDPVRAVRAAKEIHILARELSPDVEAKIGQPLAMHTGINTGLVLTSNADSRDGTVGVTGDTVNTGARLKVLATDDEILLSPETARRVDPFVKLETLDATDLKGKQAPVTPYKVIGEVSGKSRFEAASAHRGFTAFTGRGSEMAQLTGALKRSVSGEGQLVTVVGEAGVGKSRLIHEFRNSIDRDEVAVLEGRCQSYGAETPYLPLLDALRRGLRLHKISDAGTVHNTAVTNIRNISADLERYLPHLLQLLSIASEEYKLPEGLQGDALRGELEEALAAIITLTAANKPMALILEDWHWADEASDTTLNHLLGVAGHYPLLLVVLYRPEYERKWADVEQYTALVLQFLNVTQTAKMLGSVLGARSLPDGLPEAVHSRTGGNALFNEEIAYALRDEHMVTVEDDKAALTRPLGDLVLPDSVHAVIRARVDRLEAEDREVLRLASVIGREFDKEVLERIASSEENIGAALARLSRQNLVHQVRVVPSAEYLFKHVLTQEVVYDTLLLSQRTDLHAAVGAAIEHLHAGRLEEHYESLADHYARSSDATKAIEYLQKAGDKAVELFIINDAIARYRGVLDRTHNLGSDQNDLKQLRVNVTIKLINVGWSQPSPEFFAYIEESIRYARELDDESSLGHLMFCIGRVSWMLGNVNDGYGQLQEAHYLAESTGQPELDRMVRTDLVAVCSHLAKLPEAVRHRDFVRDQIEARQTDLLDAYADSFASWAQSMMGDFVASERSAAPAVNSPVAKGNVFVNAWGNYWNGLQYQMAAQWHLASDAFAAAIPLFEQMGDKMGQGLCLSGRGFARFMLGLRESVSEEVQTGERHLLESGSKLAVVLVLVGRAEIKLLQGDHEDVVVLANRMSSLIELGSNAMEARAETLRGLAASLGTGDNMQESFAVIEKAIQLAKKRMQRPDEAWGRFRYAECLHKKGNIEAAKEQLSLAESLFDDMGMNWWIEQAQGLRGRLDRVEQFKWFAPFVDGAPNVDGEPQEAEKR